MYTVYCDGATSNNGYENSYGGWAWICVENQKYNSGFIKNATNNICELTAAIEACKAINEVCENDIINIYCDSAYIVNCYQQKWWEKWEINGWNNSKKEPVKNRELWEQLIPYFKNSHFNFLKVKGHSTDIYNIMVDKMAVAAKKEIKND